MMKLLLVEDATIYLILLQKLLENDFQITLSKNIADAKEIIGDQDYQFDVMLIDLITEGAMDLIRQIKKNKRLAPIPIVALTASDNPKDLIQAFDYGVYDCVQKPIYEEVVLRRVKNAANNYLRLKEINQLRKSILNNQQIDELTKIYNLDTAKWLINEKLNENKNGTKILFLFRLKGLKETYLQEGKMRGDSLVKKISDFIKLVDAAMRQLSKEERGILKMSFLDKVHYSECNCSQSTFFIKRKIACHKLYDLIFVKAQWHEIEQTFYSLKIN